MYSQLNLNLGDIWLSVMISQVLMELNFILSNPTCKLPNRYIASENLTIIVSFQIPASVTPSARITVGQQPIYMERTPNFGIVD
jgi:hypothetical protein